MNARDFASRNSERVIAEAFLREYMGRDVLSLDHSTPDWTYVWQGERWFIEVTSASLRPKDHRLAYRQRMVADVVAINTVPSSSGVTADGQRFGTYTVTVADEAALAAQLRDALRKKGPGAKAYGAPTRTHLLIDASGDQVDDSDAIRRVMGGVSVPPGYPYVAAVVWFAVDDWERRFVSVAAQA